jgi:hypothetical protein
MFLILSKYNFINKSNRMHTVNFKTIIIIILWMYNKIKIKVIIIIIKAINNNNKNLIIIND